MCIHQNFLINNIDLDETDANNKEILDDPSKQKLSYQEIEKLKKQGLEGQVKKFDLLKLIRLF